MLAIRPFISPLIILPVTDFCNIFLFSSICFLESAYFLSFSASFSSYQFLRPPNQDVSSVAGLSIGLIFSELLISLVANFFVSASTLLISIFSSSFFGKSLVTISGDSSSTISFTTLLTSILTSSPVDCVSIISFTSSDI